MIGIVIIDEPVGIYYGGTLSIKSLYCYRKFLHLLLGIVPLQFLLLLKLLSQISVQRETSEKVRYILNQVVAEGSGKNAYIPGYQIGGKTATSENSR